MTAVVMRRVGFWVLGTLAFALAVSFAPHATAAACKAALTGACVAPGAACGPPTGKCTTTHGPPPLMKPHCVCVAQPVSTHPSACKQGCQTQFHKCERQPKVVGQVAKCEHALQLCEKSCG